MMKDPCLFAMFGAALVLVPPWQVTSVEFDQDAGELQIRLDFAGSSDSGGVLALRPTTVSR